MWRLAAGAPTSSPPVTSRPGPGHGDPTSAGLGPARSWGAVNTTHSERHRRIGGTDGAGEGEGPRPPLKARAAKMERCLGFPPAESSAKVPAAAAA